MNNPFATPGPPETEFELSGEQFHDIKKHSFKVADWFYCKSGAELEAMKCLRIFN